MRSTDRTLWRNVANDPISSHFRLFLFFDVTGVTALPWALQRVLSNSGSGLSAMKGLQN